MFNAIALVDVLPCSNGIMSLNCYIFVDASSVKRTVVFLSFFFFAIAAPAIVKQVATAVHADS